MVRGSTPTFTVLLPIDVSNLSSLVFNFVQDGSRILSFGLERLATNGKEVSFVLSEEETLAFSADSMAEMQIKLETVYGEIMLSDIRKILVKKKYPEDAKK